MVVFFFKLRGSLSAAVSDICYLSTFFFVLCYIASHANNKILCCPAFCVKPIHAGRSSASLVLFTASISVPFGTCLCFCLPLFSSQSRLFQQQRLRRERRLTTHQPADGLMIALLTHAGVDKWPGRDMSGRWTILPDCQKRCNSLYFLSCYFYCCCRRCVQLRRRQSEVLTRFDVVTSM